MIRFIKCLDLIFILITFLLIYQYLILLFNLYNFVLNSLYNFINYVNKFPKPLYYINSSFTILEILYNNIQFCYKLYIKHLYILNLKVKLNYSYISYRLQCIRVIQIHLSETREGVLK